MLTAVEAVQYASSHDHLSRLNFNPNADLAATAGARRACWRRRRCRCAQQPQPQEGATITPNYKDADLSQIIQAVAK